MNVIAPTQANTFADYLEPLRLCTPPGLISPEALSRISSVASALPGSLALSVFGFECKLGEAAATSDFQLQAPASANAQQNLINLDKTAPHLLEHVIWQRLCLFAAKWSNEASPIHKAIYNLWLEFDMDGPVPQPPLPSIFFGLRGEVLEDGMKSGVENAHTASYTAWFPELSLYALRLLQGKQVPPPVAATLIRSIRSLPTGAQVGFVGAMLPRNVDAFRLIINGLTGETIPSYLQSIGWPGNKGELEQALRLTTSYGDYLWLNVDVGESILPKVSWECYLNRPDRNSFDEVRWRAFLDLLVAHDLCLPEKADALLLYPGILTAEESGELWPGSLRLLSRLLGPGTFDKLARGIHHVKVVFQPGKPLEAKAYLYARYE